MYCKAGHGAAVRRTAGLPARISTEDNAGMDPQPPSWQHSAFYRFARLDDPAGLAAALRALGPTLPGLQGAIVVASEGINGAVAGPAAAVLAFENALQQPALAAGAFARLAFKRSRCRTPPFGRYSVQLRPEIVALDLPAAAALPAPDEADDSHVSPARWRELLQRDDLVLLDNRNHFEWRLGRFRGAPDPQVHNFRDFAARVLAQAPEWRAQGKTVAMYCTGGIRCDKTAPWLRSLGLPVLQLQGGILNHFASLPDAERDWEGECLVFDRRVALDTRLCETGTRVEQVYDPALPDEAWRLRRALGLQAAAAAEPDSP